MVFCYNMWRLKHHRLRCKPSFFNVLPRSWLSCAFSIVARYVLDLRSMLWHFHSGNRITPIANHPEPATRAIRFCKIWSYPGIKCFISFTWCKICLMLDQSTQDVKSSIISSLLLFRPGGCFTNVSRALPNSFSKFVYCGNRTCFEHTHKVSAWNSHHKWVFWYCVFSWDYFGKLAKH